MQQPSVFQAASFGDLLLNEKQKKPFVSLKDQVTITQPFLTAASVLKWITRRTELIRICFVVTLEGSISVFFLFCFSSFKTLPRAFVIELPFYLDMFFLAAIVTLASGAQSID